MENVTHSSKRASSAAATGGYRSRAMYDDVFGGPPRLHGGGGGGAGLSPRVEDYKEIFGGFHAPSSSRASIPVLDLPSSSSYDDLDARAPSTHFEYADVFGGFADADFAVSYDELVRMMANGRGGGLSSGEDDGEEDDAWTLSEGEYLSEGSNAKNRCLSDGDCCESANSSTEFSISYHKAGQSSADLSNGITHVAQIPSGPEYSCVVDRNSSFSNTDDDYLPYKVNNGHLNADFSGEIVGGRLLRKTMSQPANGDGNGSMFGDDIRSYKEYVRNGSFPNEPFVTITDVSLRTQPSDLPPPRRPPPALDVQKSDLDSLQAEHGGFDYEGNDGDSFLAYFDVVVDAGSSAVASAAAMKEAVEKAQAKMKSAKELMEKRKGNEQTYTKSISMRNSKDMEERVTQQLDESSTRRDERLQSSSRGQEFGEELLVSQEKQNTRYAPHTIPDSADRKSYPTLTKKYPEDKHGRESLSSQGSAGIDGDDEWKEATQYYELVKLEKSRRPFNQANGANVMGKTVNDNKLEKKGKSGMNGLEQGDLIMGLTRTKSKLEGNHARPEASKLHQGLGKVLSVGEDIKWEENGKKLIVEQRPVENDAQDVEENAEKFELNGWFQQTKSQSESEIKKTVKQNGEGVEPTKAARAKSKQIEKEIKMAHEQAENEKRVKEAFEQDEKEKKTRKKWELEKNDKKQKQASRREENESRLKEALQLEESRRQEEVLEKEARDRTMKENRKKEESGRKQKVAIEKEETEKREKAAQEREEKEKRLKETIEKEKEMRLREMVQREEIEQKQREAREKQKLEKRLEREKKKRIIQESAAREENGKKQREYHERKEKETRMRETLEREENQRRPSENCEREERVKNWREATEKEQVKERVKQDMLFKETGGSVEEGHDKEDNERCLKASKNGIVDVEETEICSQEETVNKMHEMHDSEVADGSEKVMLNGESWVELNHNTSPSESRFDGTNNSRDSRLPVKQKSSVGEVDTRLDNDRNVGIQAEPWDTQRGSTLGRPEEFNNAKSTDVLQRGSDGGGHPLPSEDYPAENLKKAGEFRDAAQQWKFDISRSASSFVANVGDPSMKAGHGRNEEGENIEHAQVTSSQEGIKGNFVPARVVKDEETNEIRRKGALPHSAKVEVKESVQRMVPNAVSEQTVERKAKNLHATMSSVQKESERVKREKDLEHERLKKLEEEREREREREKDRMAVDKSTLEARVNAESRDKAERAAVERIMNEARERLEKACAEAREKSLADKAPVDARLRAERAAAERTAAEARERAYRKAMAERATFDTRDRVESSMSGNLSASSRIGVRPNFSNHADGSYYMERSGVEGESPQRCKARLERHQRTAERAAKALAEKNMRDLIAQREQAERNRLAETLDADVKRWSSGKEGNLRALLSTLQYILGPDSGWQPVPLTEVITAAAVKKAYRKATLCVHPDKLQQRGASIQQKYICEKVFDLLKEAWTRFNSEER